MSPSSSAPFEVIGLLTDKLGLTGQPWDFINGIDINTAGRIIVGIFILVWIGAVAYYKIDEIGKIATGRRSAHRTSRPPDPSVSPGGWGQPPPAALSAAARTGGAVSSCRHRRAVPRLLQERGQMLD